MKPIGSLRPEPPPPPRPNWLAIGMASVTVAVYFGLFLLACGGIIADWVVILILAIATPIVAVVIALLAAQHSQGHWKVPPTYDLYTVWPIELGDLKTLWAERNEQLARRKPPSAGRKR